MVAALTKFAAVLLLACVQYTRSVLGQAEPHKAVFTGLFPQLNSHGLTSPAAYGYRASVTVGTLVVLLPEHYSRLATFDVVSSSFDEIDTTGLIWINSHFTRYPDIVPPMVGKWGSDRPIYEAGVAIGTLVVMAPLKGCDKMGYFDVVTRVFSTQSFTNKWGPSPYPSTATADESYLASAAIGTLAVFPPFEIKIYDQPYYMPLVDVTTRNITKLPLPNFPDLSEGQYGRYWSSAQTIGTRVVMVPGLDRDQTSYRMTSGNTPVGIFDYPTTSLSYLPCNNEFLDSTVIGTLVVMSPWEAGKPIGIYDYQQNTFSQTLKPGGDSYHGALHSCVTIGTLVVMTPLTQRTNVVFDYDTRTAMRHFADTGFHPPIRRFEDSVAVGTVVVMIPAVTNVLGFWDIVTNTYSQQTFPEEIFKANPTLSASTAQYRRGSVVVGDQIVLVPSYAKKLAVAVLGPTGSPTTGSPTGSPTTGSPTGSPTESHSPTTTTESPTTTTWSPTQTGDQPHQEGWVIVDGGGNDKDLNVANGLGQWCEISGDGNTIISMKKNIKKIMFSSLNANGFWTAQSQSRADWYEGLQGSQKYYDVDISYDGNTAVTGIQYPQNDANFVNVGVVCIHERSGTVWDVECFKPSNFKSASPFTGFYGCGTSVAISGDGNTVITGCDGDASMHTFVRSGSSWVEDPNYTEVYSALTRENSIALNFDGTTVAISMATHVYVMVRDGQTWTKQRDSNGSESFAHEGFNSMWAHVTISDDGNTIAKGDFMASGGPGSVWVWTRSDHIWTLFGGTMLPPADRTTINAGFGYTLALSGNGDKLEVGGFYERNYKGTAWIYKRGSDGFELAATILSPGPGTYFGATAASFTQSGEELLLSTADGKMWLYTVGRFSLAPTVTTLSPTERNKIVQTVSLEGTFEAEYCNIAFSGDGFTLAISDAFTNQGGVKVFTRGREGPWSQQEHIVGSGSGRLGTAMALSYDGNILAVGDDEDGGNQKGAVWVWERSGTTWTLIGEKIVPPQDDLEGAAIFVGSGVALSNDGNTLAFSAYGNHYNEGTVWVYTRSGDAYIKQAKLMPIVESQFARMGHQLAMSGDGNTIAAGGRKADSEKGNVWVFRKAEDTWAEEAKLRGTYDADSNSRPIFGACVDVDDDGSTLIMSSPYDDGRKGSGRVWKRSGTTWTETAQLRGTHTAGESEMGKSCAINAAGTRIALGAYNDDSGKGAAWVFDYNGAEWEQYGNKLVTSTSGVKKEGFGIAITGDGYTIATAGENSHKQIVTVYEEPFTYSPTSSPTTTTDNPTRAPSLSPTKSVSPTRTTKSPSRRPIAFVVDLAVSKGQGEGVWSASPTHPTLPIYQGGFLGTNHPTVHPPTFSPTKSPTTGNPTTKPTNAPTTKHPTSSPTRTTTDAPSGSPSPKPTQVPTTPFPTNMPTINTTYVVETTLLNNKANNPEYFRPLLTNDYKYLWVEGIDYKKIKFDINDDTAVDDIAVVTGTDITSAVPSFDAVKKTFKVVVTQTAVPISKHAVFPLQVRGNVTDSYGVCAIKVDEATCINIPMGLYVPKEKESVFLNHTAYCKGTTFHNHVGAPGTDEIKITLPSTLELRHHLGHHHARFATKIMPATAESKWSGRGTAQGMRSLVKWGEQCRKAGGVVETFGSAKRWNGNCQFHINPEWINYNNTDVQKKNVTEAPSPHPTATTVSPTGAPTLA